MSQIRGKWQSQCFTVCYTSIAHDTFRVAGQWSVPGNNASDFLSGKWPSQCFTVCRASIGWTLLELLINEILSHVLQDVCLFIKEARGDTILHQTRRQTRLHGQSPMNVTISYDYATEIIGFNGCGPGSINRTKYCKCQNSGWPLVSLHLFFSIL